MRFCPYAQRTVLILNAKKVPYEVVNINLTEKPEWLTSKSPFGKVPALEIENNLTIYESLVTSDYLDDKYPNPPLTATDPLRKAQDKLIIENFTASIVAFYKAMMQKESAPEKLNEGLTFVQSELEKRSTKFLAGSQPGMVDYMIWPWFERFGLLPLRGYKDMAMDPIKYKTLISWMDQMKEDPAVKAYYLDLETHNRFFDKRVNGDVDCYDILI
ncbi:pyrimidodiazepine synthase-like isoform X2 [Arctopsyche grandis]